jgi:hypothetical protein
MYQLCKGDYEKVKEKMPTVVEGMLDCYDGVRDHADCKNSKYKGILCSGKRNKLWCDVSDHLRLKGIRSLRMTCRDRLLLKNIINMKLGPKALESLKQRKTTQCCESRNSAIRANCIRSRRWPRNVKAKIHSAVHRCNHGPEKSYCLKLKKAGCRVYETTKRVFEEQQKRIQFTIDHKKLPPVIARERELKREKRRGWYVNKDKQGDDTEYRKHQYTEAVQEHKAAVTRSKRALKRIQIKTLKGDKTFVFSKDQYGRLWKGTQRIGKSESLLKAKYKAARASWVKARQMKAEEDMRIDRVNRAARRLIATRCGQGLDHIYFKGTKHLV